MSDIAPIDPPKNIDRSPKYTDIEKLRELVTVKGLSYAQSGKVLDITKQAVSALCKRHGIMSKNALKRFKNNKADILSSKQAQILSNIDNDRLQKASAYQLAGMFGILYDKERLERGESTQNVSVQHIEALKTLEAVDAEIDSITKGLPTDTSDDSEIQALEAEMARIKGKNETPENE